MYAVVKFGEWEEESFAEFLYNGESLEEARSKMMDDVTGLEEANGYGSANYCDFDENGWSVDGGYESGRVRDDQDHWLFGCMSTEEYVMWKIVEIPDNVPSRIQVVEPYQNLVQIRRYNKDGEARMFTMDGQMVVEKKSSMKIR